jgi:hypothetical protein
MVEKECIEEVIRTLFGRPKYVPKDILDVEQMGNGCITVKREKGTATYRRFEQLRARQMTNEEEAAFRLAERHHNLISKEYSRLEASYVPELAGVVRMLGNRGRRVVNAETFCFPDAQEAIRVTRRAAIGVDHKLYMLYRSVQYRKDGR